MVWNAEEKALTLSGLEMRTDTTVTNYLIIHYTHARLLYLIQFTPALKTMSYLPLAMFRPLTRCPTYSGFNICFQKNDKSYVVINVN